MKAPRLWLRRRRDARAARSAMVAADRGLTRARFRLDNTEHAMSLTTTLKASARRFADRLAGPYVSRIETAVRSAEAEVLTALETRDDAAPEGCQVPSETFHMAIHELRTLELERVPKGSRHVLSVGAHGGWYF